MLSGMVQHYPAAQNLILAFGSLHRATPENSKNATEHYQTAMGHLELYDVQISVLSSAELRSDSTISLQRTTNV